MIFFVTSVPRLMLITSLQCVTDVTIIKAQISASELRLKQTGSNAVLTYRRDIKYRTVDNLYCNAYQAQLKKANIVENHF